MNVTVTILPMVDSSDSDAFFFPLIVFLFNFL